MITFPMCLCYYLILVIPNWFIKQVYTGCIQKIHSVNDLLRVLDHKFTGNDWTSDYFWRHWGEKHSGQNLQHSYSILAIHSCICNSLEWWNMTGVVSTSLFLRTVSLDVGPQMRVKCVYELIIYDLVFLIIYLMNVSKQMLIPSVYNHCIYNILFNWLQVNPTWQVPIIPILSHRGFES